MRKIQVGLLGLGTVGMGVYKLLRKRAETMDKTIGAQLEIKKNLVHNKNKKREGVDETLLTDDWKEIIEDDEIQIVIEVIGGIEPAKTMILEALKAGKNVVSANKDLIAEEGKEIFDTAQAAGKDFLFEAAVAGGIPIIRPLKQCLAGNDLTDILGIVNGTTNYILTKMFEDGMEFSDALKKAQELGYAEADPTKDVEGYDAMYKLSILASMAFHVRLPIEHILREGISTITKDDIAAAKELGMEIKLLAIGKREGEHVELRVHPTMIPNTHPLAGVKGSFNAIMVHGSAVDDVMFYGRGAGDLPTASAVVSDIVYSTRTKEHRYMTFMNEQKKLSPTLVFNTDWRTGCYMRMIVWDKPGTMAKIASIIGDNGINLTSVLQKDTDGEKANIVFMVKNAHENALQKAIREIAALEEVVEVSNVIRVETFEKDR